jgi:hypothetical protein
MFGGQEKAQLWSHVLLPVAFLCLGSPISLMALPSLVTSTLSGRVGHTEWSWRLYYEMPLMPILFIAAMDGTNRLIRVVRKIAAWNEAKGMDWLGHRLVPPIAGVVLGLFALQITWSVTQTEALGIWAQQTNSYAAQPGQIANVTAALKYIPSGVQVRATNNLVVPLAARDNVTLIGSQVEKGSWAAMDLANPGCPVSADFTPGYLSTLERQGFQIVDEEGPIVVLHQA